MSRKYLMAGISLALLMLSGCATAGSNTNYAQWQGATPEPNFATIRSGGVSPGY